MAAPLTDPLDPQSPTVEVPPHDFRCWLLKKVHFYLAAGSAGFVLIVLTLVLPEISISFFEEDAGECARHPDGNDCKNAKSKASLAIATSSGAKAFVALALGPTLGALSDQIGRRFFCTSCAAAVLVGVLALLAHVYGYASLWLFFFLNIFSGLILPALLSVVADEHVPSKRASAFGRLTAVFEISVLLSPLLGKLQIKAAMAVIAAAATASLLLIAVYPESLPRSQRIPHERSQGAATPWRPDVALGILNSSPLFRRLSLVIVGSSMTMAGAQQCFVLFLTAAFRMSRARAGGVLAILGASGLVTQLFLLPLLQRRMGVTSVLMLGLAMQVVQNALMLVPNLDTFMVSAVIGGCASIVFPCVSAIKANAGSSAEQGRIQGAVSCLQSCSLGVGPLLYGPIFAWLVGPHAPGGSPQPHLLWFVSIMLLLPTVAVTATLHRYVDDGSKNAQPVVRRAVSLFRRDSSSSNVDFDCPPQATAGGLSAPERSTALGG